MHAVTFMRRWGGGFGLYGEQGAQNIHHLMIYIDRTHARMKPDRKRLKSMMKEHLHPSSSHGKTNTGHKLKKES